PLKRLSDLHNVVFRFITPLSPWKGGMYEKIIGILKSYLKKITLVRPLQSLSFFETVLAEATDLVNSRPLAPLDLEEGTVLTPKHFLFPYEKNSLSRDEEPKKWGEVSMPKGLKTAWAEVKDTIIELWNIWGDSYLNALKERNQHAGNTKWVKTTKVGMLVLCTERGKDQRKWHLGIVEKIHPDSSGNIRSVKVRHPDRKVYDRPPELLV
ncbi:unnamed protein product, partial [Auanema sp. JU1783]